MILPEPIDQTTTKFDASLEYNGKESQWRLNLHGSLFDNSNPALRWQDPGFTLPGANTRWWRTLWAARAGARQPVLPARSFRYPSAHRYHSLTGTLSVGLMQQDDDFHAIRSWCARRPLPRDSLEGEVYVYSLRTGMTSRPYQATCAEGQYSYDERDNRTPKESYLYEVMDSGKNPNPAIAVPTNR